MSAAETFVGMCYLAAQYYGLNIMGRDSYIPECTEGNTSNSWPQEYTSIISKMGALGRLLPDHSESRGGNL